MNIYPLLDSNHVPFEEKGLVIYVGEFLKYYNSEEKLFKDLDREFKKSQVSETPVAFSSTPANSQEKALPLSSYSTQSLASNHPPTPSDLKTEESSNSFELIDLPNGSNNPKQGPKMNEEPQYDPFQDLESFRENNPKENGVLLLERPALTNLISRPLPPGWEVRMGNSKLSKIVSNSQLNFVVSTLFIFFFFSPQRPQRKALLCRP